MSSISDLDCLENRLFESAEAPVEVYKGKFCSFGSQTVLFIKGRVV